MGDFGWSYISGANLVGQGPLGAIQYNVSTDGRLSGSSLFTYLTGSESVVLSGSMYVSGTLYANTMDILTTTKTEIHVSGNTSFGDSGDDVHSYTGSVFVSGIQGNKNIIEGNTTIPADFNSLLLGPMTISSSVTLTIGERSILKII